MVSAVDLKNTPATFQDMMNRIMKDLLDEVVVVYIDNVLIYATLEGIHDLHVKEVLKRLAENELIIS
jgi:hypothetical protein